MPTLKSGSVLLPDVGMSQGTLIVGTLIGGFIVWVALNGKLPTYWQILTGGAATPAATSSASPSATAATASNTTPVTTPQPSATPTPLGQGGIGSA